MRPLMLIPLAAFLALAACDDTQDVAQTEPEATTSAPDTAAAPPPVSTDTARPADTAAAPSSSTNTASAPPASSTTTTSTAPARDTAAAPSASEPQATGAVSAGDSLQPGLYQAQDVSIDLRQDGTFTLTNPSTGDEAQGEYLLEGTVLTLMTEGDPAEPMTCDVVTSGEGFEISATDPSCEPLDGQTFQPQG